MAEVHALLSEDMGVVDWELARLAREGASPGTDSATHLLEGGGKRIRPLTVLLSAACFGPVPAPARDLAVVAELVHLATLLHDDVVDDGMERRGRPTPRRIWGNAVSVLAGDLLLTHALERTAACAPGPVLSDLFATLRRLVDGEIVQLRGRTDLDVREEVYFRVVRDKTASLFAWAARAGAATVPNAPADAMAALGEFGTRVGVAFQLVDDVLDYQGDPGSTGKALLGDSGRGQGHVAARANARRPARAARGAPGRARGRPSRRRSAGQGRPDLGSVRHRARSGSGRNQPRARVSRARSRRHSARSACRHCRRPLGSRGVTTPWAAPADGG